MEWDSEGGVEYAKFTTTLVNLPTEKVNPAGFISKLKKFTLQERASEEALKDNETVSKTTLGVSSVLGMQNAGKFEGGDPFLAKLLEID